MLRSASRGAREEDHAFGVARYLGERANHDRLSMPIGMRKRDGRPQPGVELAAELRHQPRLILRKLDIPLRDDNLAMTRFHPKKAHRQSMPDADRAPNYFWAAALTRLRPAGLLAALLACFLPLLFLAGTTAGTFGHFVPVW